MFFAKDKKKFSFYLGKIAIYDFSQVIETPVNCTTPLSNNTLVFATVTAPPTRYFCFNKYFFAQNSPKAAVFGKKLPTACTRV